MPKRSSIHMIHAFRKRWRFRAMICRILLALAIGAIAAAIIADTWWALLITAVALLTLLLPAAWRITTNDVVRYFNINYPEVEESCGMVLLPRDNLGLLEQLQVQKVEQALGQLHPQPPIKKQLWMATGVFIAAIVLMVIILYRAPLSRAQPLKSLVTTTAKEQHPLAITGVNITIQPPAYTRKPARQQQQFNLEAEEGAIIQWHITTNQPANALQLILNDSARLSLQAGKNKTIWEGRIIANHSGFYQLQLAGKLSELYKIAITKDQPPQITIQTPKPYTTIDFGDPQRIGVKVNIADDYGISAATIQATVASGSGEAVKFKEQAIPFGEPINGSTQYLLEKTLQLAQLGMEPGSELYFYIQATDNHHQSSRSGMYMVVLPDTAQLMSIEGMANSVNLKPEYFRSQRQIIIETEQLIRDKDTISEKDFKSRSNDLGIDQRLLRLRYGKFLGEESETNIGDDRVGEADHDHDAPAASDAKDFNNAEKIIDQFSHRHDIAEDASFFDPDTKTQLKATLTEMWNAELRLRTFKPQEALPYEYKALRLLKDLQQKSRVYVAKTSVKTPPLKPEKRLTGELDKIILPITQHSYEQLTTTADQLAYALAVLETLKGRPSAIDLTSLQVLQQGARQMSRQATADPARYLEALQALRKIITALEQRQPADSADVMVAAESIYRLLPAPARLPYANTVTNGMSLSQQYFMNLNQQP